MKSLHKALLFGALDFILVVLVILFIKNKYAVVLTILIAQVAYLAYLITLLELQIKKKKEEKEKRIEEAIEAKKREDHLKKELEKEKEKQKEVKMKSVITNYSQVKEYIAMALQRKFSEAEIRNKLLSVGWSLTMINKAFNQVKSQ